MGMIFIIRTEEEYHGRSVMWCARSRAELFFDIAKLLEERLQQPCGLTNYSSIDEYGVNPTEFINFLECFMSYVWDGEGVDHLYNWAEYAAGMIINITLEPRFWKNRHGQTLFPVRYMLDGETEIELSRKEQQFEKQTKKLFARPHCEFSEFGLEYYVHLIANATLKTQ